MIVWRKDVKLTHTTDSTGTSYVIPVTDDSPLPKWTAVRIANRSIGRRYCWSPERRARHRRAQ